MNDENRMRRSSGSQEIEPEYLRDASKPNTGWYRRLVTSNTSDLIQPRANLTQPHPPLPPGAPWRNLKDREAERPFAIVGDLVSLAWPSCQRPIRRDVGGFQASRWPQQSTWRQCHAVSRRQLRGKPQHLAIKTESRQLLLRPDQQQQQKCSVGRLTMAKIHLSLLNLPRTWTLGN